MPRDKDRARRKQRYQYELEMRGITKRARSPLQAQYRFPHDPPLDAAQTDHLVERWHACKDRRRRKSNDFLRVETERVALLMALEPYEIRALMDALKEEHTCD